MAKSNSKKKVLKNAQKVAAVSSLNSVANNKKKSQSDNKAASAQKSTASSAKKDAKKTSPATAPKAKGKKNTSKKKSQKVVAGRPWKDKAVKGKHSASSKAGKFSAHSAAALKQTGKDEKNDGKKIAKGKMSAGKRVLIVCAAVVALVFAGSCIAFAAIEQSRSEHVPQTTMLDGQVDVSGLTEEELREVVEARVANEISTTLTLNVGDTNHQIRMADIGTINIDRTIEQAFAPYGDNLVTRYFMTMGEFFQTDPPEFDVSTMCDVDHEMLEDEIARISANSGAGPKNAGYAFDDGTRSLVIAPAKQGVIVNEPETVGIIEEVLAAPGNGDPKRLMIQADVTVAEPESYAPGQAILVDTVRCFVQLYQDGEMVEQFDCTPGTSGYATPTGDFYLSYKDAAPTWYNPHSAWSEGMEETIPPGPSNPLGVRALAVSCGNGIFIHGTSNVGGLGSPGSHGCVRLSNNNITKLFDMVSEGIPIIIR